MPMSTLIHILTNNDCPNSRAFNAPLLGAKEPFRRRGFSLHFSFGPPPSHAHGDILFINSNIFRPFWKTDHNKIFRFLEQAQSKKRKILWFDTTDSTWCTQFEAMPYVDRFLKSQLLKDRRHYLTPFRTGRIFTDAFDDLYHAGEAAVDYPAARPEDLDKLGLSWNTCFENYTASRHGSASRFRQRLRPWLANFAGERLTPTFDSPRHPRPTPVSCRVGLGHDRPSVVAHRRAVLTALAPLGVSGEKIPLSQYFQELRTSQIGIGPFGVGEITLRDYEIILCGAALVKPDLGHLETWPDLFQPGRTYQPHRWDLADLREGVEHLLAEPDRRLAMAAAAQAVYREALSEAGMDAFAERLISLAALEGYAEPFRNIRGSKPAGT